MLGEVEAMKGGGGNGASLARPHCQLPNPPPPARSMGNVQPAPGHDMAHRHCLVVASLLYRPPRICSGRRQGRQRQAGLQAGAQAALYLQMWEGGRQRRLLLMQTCVLWPRNQQPQPARLP